MLVDRLLTFSCQLPYYEVLLDAPFKGDELPLRAMEHAEIISISTYHGTVNHLGWGTTA
jgi:hypothetical protein